MKSPQLVKLCLIVLALLAVPFSTAGASINSMGLGAAYDSARTQVTFRVYSSRATTIVLYLYSAGYGVQESATHALSPLGGGVWQVIVPVSAIQAAGITGTIYYGYRAWGPNWPYSSSWAKGSSTGFVADVDANGNRFNPNKLLLDPYAREISQDVLNVNNQNAGIFASGASYRSIDSGTYAPKGIVLAPVNNSTGTRPTRAQKDDVIYEVNVRGLTRQDPGTPSQYQGTYYGAGLKAGYLASLGVTAVEFLPVQETQNDANDVTPGSDVGQNYWGYSTENYFAPDRRYAYNKSPGGPTAEFQQMVNAFHNAGIKVYIDAVYNHTNEGGTWSGSDPTVATVYSWRGLDNATYYELTADNQYFYDNTGTGGNYNTYNVVAQNLVIDSMAYWIGTLGVDGFRFDLGVVLGNACLNGAAVPGAPNCPQGGFYFDVNDPNVAINRILSEFSVRPAGGGNGIDLYAEPWGLGSGTYQLGAFPVGYSEWNGIYRDSLRQAQNELGVMTYPSSVSGSSTFVEQDATDWTGSSNLFQWNRQPWNSTNFMDLHDGLTLNDVYSCNTANNSQAWPWGPSDGGTSTNYSWDQGGAAADQRRAARTGLAFEMLSAGTPLLEGGDEFLRTLQCNNNAYNLDSPGNWLNYSLSSDQANFSDFAQRAIAFRKAHPALRPATWYTSSQVLWWEPSGVPVTSDYWNSTTNYALAYTINGSSFGDSNSIYIAFNGWSGQVTFTLPTPPTGTNWYRVTDTCNWNDGPNTWVAPGNEASIGSGGATYNLCGRALLLLISK
jgi:isoamylase